MKHIIWLLFLFLFFDFHFISAQQSTSIVLASKGPPLSQQGLAFLPSITSQIKSTALLPLPILRLPKSFDKKYIIRVHQSDTAIFQKFLDVPIGLKYHRGFDHKGYDYFLPISFHNEKAATSYLAKLKSPIFSQAVVVKKVPKNASCNCFKRF